MRTRHDIYEALLCHRKVGALWALPKGTPTKHESPIYTAIREAREETGINVKVIHSGIAQQERFSILTDFRNSKHKILVTTDVTARGIDLPSVEYVVNYDLPENPENYVHRCGRTGRGRNKGMAISFCSKQEQEFLSNIEDYTGENIHEYEINTQDYRLILNETNDIKSNWKKLIDDCSKENKNINEW